MTPKYPYDRMRSLATTKNDIKSIEQCERELANLGYSEKEVKELRDILINMIEGVLDNYLSQFYERN